jgi:uncharacterized protein YcbK (DUF882 family)
MPRAKFDYTAPITPHFIWSEFLDPDIPLPPDWVLNHLRQLATKLEQIRQRLGNLPITIHSGYRTVQHNRSVGGRVQSFHLIGMAADFSVAGLPAYQVQSHLIDWPGGMGCYQNFTHIDIRPYKARWKG